MFNSQMVRLKIDRTLKWPTFSMFPTQMVRLKIEEPTFSMFPSQIVRLKIAESSSIPLLHVSLTNGGP